MTNCVLQKTRRQSRGRTNFHAGQVAEDVAARTYARRGLVEASRRWRGESGEIDLVLRDGEGLIFVEVKRGRDFDRAAQHLTHRQICRIFAAAQEYVANEPRGELTDMRFDLALVDDMCAVEIRENALAA